MEQFDTLNELLKASRPSLITPSLVHIMVCCLFYACSEPSNAGLSINWTVRNKNFNKILNKITTFLSRICIWKYWKYRLQSGISCRPQCVDMMAAWFKIIGLGYHVYQFITVRRGLLCTGGLYHNGNRHFDSFQCSWKTFMVHQTFVRWALYILFKYVKSLIRHLVLAIRNVRHVQWFSWTLSFSDLISFLSINRHEKSAAVSFHDITVPAQRPFNIMLTGDDMDFASKSDQSSWSRNVSKPRDWALFLWFQLSSTSALFLKIHDDVIKWKQYLYYWSFVMCVRGIHRSGSPVNSPHKLVIGEFPAQTWQRTSNATSE